MNFKNVISPDQATALAREFGTPLYVYNEDVLRANAAAALAFPNAFGLTVRYAVKAAPNRSILRLFHSLGLHFDASSIFEAERIIAAGIPADRISLSTQELGDGFESLVRRGMSVNACSLAQMEKFGKAFPGARVGLRVNPGLGSGGTNRTNVGGPASSFGIWHAQLDQAKAIADRHNLRIFRIHTHIGSGSDPAVWQRVAELSIDTVRRFPDVSVLNLGGGYKVARMPDEQSTDLQQIGQPVRAHIEAFAAETGRKLHFEIEPGTFLVATAGALLATVQDTADTGADGYAFIKLDCGMNDILRPSIYGAQHFIEVVGAATEESDYVVVGHCCESGDILTPARGDPELLAPRRLRRAAIGDHAIIYGAGAYCSGMPAKNYNSFPEAAEVLLRSDGSHALIRRRQDPASVWANELDLPGLTA